ncbi:MAG TPA: PrgI family protein [Candidatus Kapabacteria bacterium]|nr:PrgI family protein [Candidatus Kapabacteria bacterium]
MQQFVVPQFIEVEDKIFGPITTRQFLILLVVGLLIFVIFRLADFKLFLLLSLPLGGLALLFAFYKVNGQTFHYFLLNVIQTLRKPGIRIWRKEYSKEELNYLRKLGMETPMPVEEKKDAAKREHIRDLSLIVNTGGFYRGEE